MIKDLSLYIEDNKPVYGDLCAFIKQSYFSKYRYSYKKRYMPYAFAAFCEKNKFDLEKFDGSYDELRKMVIKSCVGEIDVGGDMNKVRALLYDFAKSV